MFFIETLTNRYDFINKSFGEVQINFGDLYDYINHLENTLDSFLKQLKYHGRKRKELECEVEELKKIIGE